MKLSVNEWQRLQQLAAIGELTVGIVHDLKNQLACVGVNLEMLELLNEKESLKKYITHAKRQMSYIEEMVTLTLKMGAKNENFKHFDLSILLDDVATFFSKVSGKGIKIKTQHDSSKHLILGCQSLICNSILNLCANARDAVGGRGTIEITLEKDNITEIKNDILNQEIAGVYSILKVKDSGTGIAPEKLMKIFEQHYTTKTDKTNGMGIGLHNVVHTLKEHGASMTVESEIGVGTTFTLYFKASA